jgi:NAD(P)-dependent dehydrogenase (short-subunit alcohol dehydrogenase family)
MEKQRQGQPFPGFCDVASPRIAASHSGGFVLEKLQSEREVVGMDEGRGVALVTGASSGMGRETARRLAEKGFDVIVAARRMDRLEELAAQRKNITPKGVDFSNPQEVTAFCEYLSNLPEPVSVLVNNAGYSIRGALEDVPPEAVRRVFQVNLFSLIQVTQACLPAMRKKREGRIVNMSSMAGKFAFPMSGVYAATKHALEAVTDAMRLELAPFGIKVVAIRPGFVATEFNDAATRITGDLMSRTDPDYKLLYQTSGAGVGKLFVNATMTGPEPIADLILEAALSENPRMIYSGGFLSDEFLGKRFQLGDDGFNRFMGELTGLGALRV